MGYYGSPLFSQGFSNKPTVVKTFPNERKKSIQGGPPTIVINGVKWGPPISRVITPGKPIYSRPFIGALTPFITSRGPPCR